MESKCFQLQTDGKGISAVAGLCLMAKKGLAGELPTNEQACLVHKCFVEHVYNQIFLLCK